jgi:hypothetical protein
MWTTVARTKRCGDQKIPTPTSFGSAPPLSASEFGAFRHGFFYSVGRPILEFSDLERQFLERTNPRQPFTERLILELSQKDLSENDQSLKFNLDGTSIKHQNMTEKICKLQQGRTSLNTFLKCWCRKRHEWQQWNNKNETAAQKRPLST